MQREIDQVEAYGMRAVKMGDYEVADKCRAELFGMRNAFALCHEMEAREAAYQADFRLYHAVLNARLEGMGNE